MTSNLNQGASNLLPAQSYDPTLGGFVAEYRDGGKSALKAWLLGPFVMGVAVLLLVGALGDKSGQAGPATIVFASLIIAMIFAIGLAVPLKWLYRRGLSLRVYHFGIVQTLRQERKQLLWDEVTELKVVMMRVSSHGIPAGSLRRYDMRSQAGVRIIASEWLADIAKLGANIEREVTPRIASKVQARRARGETVAFGAFSIGPEGVRFKKKTLPWARFAGHGVKGGYISILERSDSGKSRRFAWEMYGAVPNAAVLLAELSKAAPAAGG